jgi:hypothetical protein
LVRWGVLETVLSRRAIRAVAFAVVGLVLLATGNVLYEGSALTSLRAASNCGNNTCVSVSANPLFWYIGFIGVLLLIVAGLLWLRLAWVSRSRPQNPA